MEFVDGRSLSEILREGPLTFEAARSLMQRVAAGLQAAHERGIIHRDVSPDNIIVPGGDVARAKIIDFGIARSTQLGQGTVIGSGFAGKYNYVSPEQLGLFGGDVTAKSDIYSLGLVLVEALTGRPLDMGGSQFEIVEKRRKVPDLGAIDMRFRPLLEQMLQPDPKDRPQLDGGGRELGAQSAGQRPRQACRPAARDTRQGSGAAQLGPLAVCVGRSGSAASARRRGWRLLLLRDADPGGAPAAANQAARPSPDELSKLTPVNPAPPPAEQAKPARPPAPPPSQTEPARPPQPAPPPTQDQAALPPQPPPTPPRLDAPGRPEDRVARIRRYIDEYDGGECFFIAPVAIRDQAAALEGFGAATRPFEVLDRAFQREIGFEASIGVRQVTQPQCPAITFLGKLRAERARAPRLQIERLERAQRRSAERLGGEYRRAPCRAAARLRHRAGPEHLRPASGRPRCEVLPDRHADGPMAPAASRSS